MGTYSLSIVIICHFLLDICHRNEYPNGSTCPSLPVPSGSFQAAANHIQELIMEEFGDIFPDASTSQELPQEGIELQELQSQNVEASVELENSMGSAPAIDLTEFPWAAGEIGEIN